MILINNKTNGICSYGRIKKHNERDSVTTKTLKYGFSKIDFYDGLKSNFVKKRRKF